MLSSYVHALLSIGVLVGIHAALGDVVNINLLDKRPHGLVAPTNWTVNFISNHQYPVETHKVITEDGYILTLHRIPTSPSSNAEEKSRPPILLHHGILGCSADWVVLGPGNALGFVLADKGYDVWLANARGTKDSKEHVRLSPAEREFWDFSWNEVGSHDLPAEIDYILNVTGKDSLTYVGFSMGTTAFWVLGATNPQYMAKIDKMIALGPIAFFGHVNGGLFKALTSLVSNAEWAVSMIGTGEFMPSNEFMTWAAKTFCKDDNTWSEALCKNVMFLLCGFDSTSIKESLIATIFEYVPAGASTREILHYAQLIREAPSFRRYDYGWIKNYLVYGMLEPPSYKLSDVTCPVHMFVGPNDWLGDVKDAQHLARQLPNVQTFKIADRDDFNHLDFVYSDDVHEIIYGKVIRTLEAGTFP